MPELPEVETVVRGLVAAGVAGRRILRAEVHWPPMVAPLAPRVFTRMLQGARITDIRRRGKYIVFGLSCSRLLLVHLRMTGRFLLAAARSPRLPHQHVRLVMDDRRCLCYHDTRKFGRWQLADARPDMPAGLGPEPLAGGFTWRLLRDRIAGRRRCLKPLLLDQTFVAGLGNIYVDEALWDARLHPLRRADGLSVPEIRALHAGIRRVLRRGIRHGGTTLGEGLGNFINPGGSYGGNRGMLKVFQRTGLPCPRCGRPVERMVVAQRGTHLCAGCQPVA